MKTTTYTFEKGKMQITVTDKPELTPGQYREACVVITAAAKEFTRKRKRYSKPLHESEHVACMSELTLDLNRFIVQKGLNSLLEYEEGYRIVEMYLKLVKMQTAEAIGKSRR